MGNRQSDVKSGGQAALRFRSGETVFCHTADGWLEGSVVETNCREEDWPAGRPSAAYRVKLTNESNMLVQNDHPDLIRGKKPREDDDDESRAPAPAKKPMPWHLRQADQLKRDEIKDVYPAKALHGSYLFESSEVERWFRPDFLEVIAAWRTSRDASSVNLDALPGVRLEMPGVLSFDCLSEEFCDKLVAEMRHYQSSGFPQRAPNSMNNYGLVLNEIGMRSAFDTFLKSFISAIGARVFGDDAERASQLGGKEDIGTEDWGGSTLSGHHTFIVRYRPDEDRHLDMHVDESDVTFNFGLLEGDGFTGSDLAICGMFAEKGHRKHHCTYQHKKGRCCVHAGKRRHGALPIETGERMSLIMWAKSPEFRTTEAYQRMWGGGRVRTDQGVEPDLVCLSETHDRDYKQWVAKLQK
eukprot:TRINITY_DN33726_c0_g1_i1.p1 TRINITY_DN33726_c0_g1~~TRINITY_DN33726_c0_g1_i1.p1  ORF type:complete len:411 (-),score=100.10 TRINITY_DN33726_c0_g1_i1:599-1831(-)